MQLPPALKQNATPLALAAGALAGAAAYFGWLTEPHPYTGPIIALCGLILLLLARITLRPAMLGGWFVWSLGLFFTLAHIQVMRADAFSWEQLVSKPHWASGQVAAIYPNESNPQRATLELHNVTFYGLPSGAFKVDVLRLGVYQSQISGTQPGYTVSAPVKVFAPAAPEKPGQRDYRLLRHLGGSALFGFAQGKLELQPGLAVPQPNTPTTAMDNIRAHVKAVTTPYADGVLTALLVAEQRQVPKDLREAYRVAGLSHLLAVSGLQLTLVGGGMFWLVRWLLAWFPALALRYNTKAFGAVAGLVSAAGYAWLAGAPVSVQRALLMVAILLLAVLLGRMRGLLRAWVAALLVVLAFNPAAVTMAGFQLSFAAVLGLIGLGHAHGHPQGWFQKAQWLARSSVVAAWATAPIILMQFGQLNVLGLAANLVAVPLMGVVTWFTFAGLVAMPVGAEGPFLWAAAKGATMVNDIAVAFSHLPLASVTLPTALWPVAAVMAILFLGAIMLKKPHASMLAALALLAFGAGAAMRAPINPVVVEEGGKTITQAEAELEATACDETGCAYQTPQGTVAVLNAPPTAEDCTNASFIIAPKGKTCPTKTQPPGTFAWATLAEGTVSVYPLLCNRPWQRLTEGCRSHRPNLGTGEEE